MRSLKIRTCGLAIALSLSLFAQSPYDAALKNLKFRSIGPATMGGRVDDIAVVESDPRVIYVGAAAGGVFKTVNGGQSWQAIFEDQPNPSIGDLALAPSNPSILYVGTGEPNNRQSSSWGNGVYKSMDGGATFAHMGLAETHHIGRIVVHPTDPDTVYVAAQGDLWGPNKERGVYKSTNGGATWTQVLSVNEDTGANDIAIDPQSPNILYATMYQRRRTVFGFDGGGPGSGIYRSTDSGAHWTKLGGQQLGRGLPATGDLGRCAIEVYRKNTNIVYALVEHRTLGGVYRSEDKGATWARMSDTNPRPSYFSQIRIDPNNDQKIWLGGVNIYMSEDGGRNFVQTRFRDVHSDVHAIWIDPANSDHMLSGNDGGVWVTWDSGRNWQHINNIALGPVLRSGVRLSEALSRVRRPAGQLLLVRSQFHHPAARASATKTGSPCRAATASTTASTPAIPTSFTRNRRTAIFRAATCAPANRNPSARWSWTTTRRAIASSGTPR